MCPIRQAIFQDLPAKTMKFDVGRQQPSQRRDRLEDGRPYLRKAECRCPRTGREGIYWLDAFQVPEDYLPGKKLRFTFDRVAWNLWRLRLIAHYGLIRPPSPRIIRDRLRKQGEVVDRKAGYTGISAAEYKKRLAAATKTAEEMEAAVIPTREAA